MEVRNPSHETRTYLLYVNVQLFYLHQYLTITGGHLCVKARMWCDSIYNTDISFDTIKSRMAVLFTGLYMHSNSKISLGILMTINSNDTL